MIVFYAFDPYDREPTERVYASLADAEAYAADYFRERWADDQRPALIREEREGGEIVHGFRPPPGLGRGRPGPPGWIDPVIIIQPFDVR
jgi:hypothetical protein